MTTILRDWMEMHHPRLTGAWDWPRYRLFSRCLVCGRLTLLHTPWRLFICERMPLPIEITEQGMARLAEYETIAETIARVSMHARSA